MQLSDMKDLRKIKVLLCHVFSAAGVVELVDTQDLKSCSCIGVPVRFRPPAPFADDFNEIENNRLVQFTI